MGLSRNWSLSDSPSVGRIRPWSDSGLEILSKAAFNAGSSTEWWFLDEIAFFRFLKAAIL